MNDKIIAVTVTYNSSSFLKRCIGALLKQTYKLDRIIVVDNNSNKEFKEQNELLASDNVEVIYLSENTGGAGGFEYGMNYAYMNYSPDWIWVMDDDAFPEEDCLEKLLQHSNYDNVGCICPAIYGVDLQKYQTYHHKKITYLFDDVPRYNDYIDFPDVFEIDADAFVGPLISKKAIDKIGVANGGLFIYGDDTEYTYRLTREFKMIVVKNAIINHRDVQTVVDGISPKIWWKEYYLIRNKYLFIREFSTSLIRKVLSTLRIRYNVFKLILSTRIKKKYKRYRKIRIKLLKKSIYDGKHSIYGKTIDPKKYLDELSKIENY